MRIELRKEFNPSTVARTIHNVTRTDLVEVNWLVFELDNLVANITSSTRWIISEENYTLLRNVFIDLGIINDNTAASGAGSAIDSSITYLICIYLRFEGIIVELKVENLCGT
jgi:hypothetical protein